MEIVLQLFFICSKSQLKYKNKEIHDIIYADMMFCSPLLTVLSYTIRITFMLPNINSHFGPWWTGTPGRGTNVCQHKVICKNCRRSISQIMCESRNPSKRYPLSWRFDWFEGQVKAAEVNLTWEMRVKCYLSSVRLVRLHSQTPQFHLPVPVAHHLFLFRYWRYNEELRAMDPGYPKPIAVWRGVPDSPQGAFVDKANGTICPFQHSDLDTQ